YLQLMPADERHVEADLIIANRTELVVTKSQRIGMVSDTITAFSLEELSSSLVKVDTLFLRFMRGYAAQPAFAEGVHI
ncbi:hypothetical protein L0F63_007042, partial [Massospora cicadina]